VKECICKRPWFEQDLLTVEEATLGIMDRDHYGPPKGLAPRPKTRKKGCKRITSKRALKRRKRQLPIFEL
jgi:hypothetical protein